MKGVVPAVLVVVIACVVLVESCDMPKDSSCDDTILRCCDADLKTALNIDCKGKAIFENPDCVEKALNDLYFGSENGAFQVCNAYNIFRTCLGQSSYSCTNYLHFLVDGVNIKLAKTDQGVYNRFNFMCGAGFDTFLRNSDAINDIAQSKHDEIKSCFDKFTYNVRSKPTKACEYLKIYTSCYQKTFGSSEIGWFACELARSYGSPLAPHCDDVSCTSN